MKKVLIISYYWPPSGGTGVQRWMHFARYLHQLGWDVTVFTPENAESAILDVQLLDQVKEIKVIHSKIWEPFNFYRKLTGKKKSERIQTGFLKENKKQSFLEHFSLWVRANLFIPDAKKMWIKPAIKQIVELQQKEHFSHIISTGPPHSTHLIAMGVKAKTKIKWLADFRDPWTNIDWFSKLPMTQKTIAKHRSLELQVLKNCDAVVTVTYEMAKEFAEICNGKIHVITNGFAPEDFANFKSRKSDKLIIFHHGSLNADRNPVKFWDFLGQCVKEDESWEKKLVIKLIGAVDISVLSKIDENGLSTYLEQKYFLPHHEVLNELSYASLCLLPLNNSPNAKGIMPNKLYEFLATGKPMVLIGPKDGDAAIAISNFENSCVFEFDEAIDKIKIEKCLKIGDQTHDLSKFNRFNLAKQINDLLNNI